MHVKTWTGAAVLLATLAVSANSATADEQGESAFTALRIEVQRQLPNASPEERQRIADARDKIVDCLVGTLEPEDSRIDLALNDVDYKYATPAVTPDDTYYCFYLVEPLHRALTQDEGRDFSAAIMMKGIIHAFEGAPKRKRRAIQNAEGELLLSELRAALPLREYKEVPKALLGRFDTTTTGLEDCSPSELEDKLTADERYPYGREMFNSYYSFLDLRDTTGARCIFLQSPVSRGLTVLEALDMIRAMQVDMGFTDKHRRELFGDGPVPPEFQYSLEQTPR
jgi:hypothetical protein